MRIASSSRICLALLALALSGSFARAETMVGSSLEWLTCESDVVVVGRIKKIVTTRGPGSVFYDDCTVAVEEVIKGKVVDRMVVFCFRSLAKESPARSWMKSEQPLLLFLSESRDHGPEKRLETMLVPASGQAPLSVIDLAAPGKYVIDRQFTVLSEKSAILETCRSTVKRLNEHLKKSFVDPQTKVKEVRLEVPTGSSAWRSLYWGSVCYLKVPGFMTLEAKKRE
jgi:hypothetical protein